MEREEGRTNTAVISNVGSFATATKNAILHKAFPETVFSAGKHTMTEEAIVKEMFSGWVHKIYFGGNYFRLGLILVDRKTVHWSNGSTRLSLKNWKKMITSTGEEI